MEWPERFKPQVEALAGHLKFVSRERNFETAPEALREVQLYLQKELSSYGFEVREDPFLMSDRSFSNLIASLPGTPAGDRLIVGAHFDAVPGSPGADDNASGVASLLECARIFSLFQKENPSVSTSCVEFAAFNLEEYGMVGSRSYAEKLKRQGAGVRGMLSLEMVGYVSQEKNSQQMPLVLKPFYPSVGNFIGLVANLKSKKFLDEAAGVFRSVEGLPVQCLTLPADGLVFPATRLSDHSSFWDQGFPALLVTDTSFFRNPHYHTEEDRIETLDLGFIAKVTEAVARLACPIG